jgi:acetoin utilization deacetylase AcuC-like enzyme
VRVVYSEQHRLHQPQHDVEGGVAVEHRERPDRAERIMHSLVEDERFFAVSPTDHGVAPIEAVHARGLIAFLEQSPVTSELIPDTVVHPRLRDGIDADAPEPMDVIGRLGYWCFDTGTPIVSGTYAAARAAVDVALTAADRVLNGENVSYGLCRPPGHHAAHAVYGGFCYFNNAAIAADYLVRQSGSPVAVLDLDYHHGNGTQQIFYRRDDVLYVSLHADPLRAYPYFTGHTDETGAGPGRGYTLNLPLPPLTTDADYLTMLDRALERLEQFAPTFTVVSLGIDTYARDPLGDFSLTTLVYAECGRRVAQQADRLVVLQEGGYYLPDLGENVHQWLLGVMRQVQ